MNTLFIFTSHHVLFTVLFALAAFLYASVGHGGASAYLALMSFYGMAPAEAKPLVLLMNMVVSFIALLSFYRKNHFDFTLFLYLAVPAVPMAYLGSRMPLSDAVYRLLLGLLLIASAIKLLLDVKPAQTIKPYHRRALVGIGVCLGWVSGMLGVGGGILLSPLLMFLAWAPAKTISGISAAFILVNSISGFFALRFNLQTIHT
ncbi:MAG: sulfite exporter TauE/SafE family protein, partial [Chitinophagaceae bacterium]|nr:sulfite exporter TauE/SafE family protein [Chitinophagaceae bacterium]